MLVFLGSVMLLFDLPNSFMEYIFILMMLFGSFFVWNHDLKKNKNYFKHFGDKLSHWADLRHQVWLGDTGTQWLRHILTDCRYPSCAPYSWNWVAHALPPSARSMNWKNFLSKYSEQQYSQLSQSSPGNTAHSGQSAQRPWVQTGHCCLSCWMFFCAGQCRISLQSVSSLRETLWRLLRQHVGCYPWRVPQQREEAPVSAWGATWWLPGP